MFIYVRCTPTLRPDIQLWLFIKSRIVPSTMCIGSGAHTYDILYVNGNASVYRIFILSKGKFHFIKIRRMVSCVFRTWWVLRVSVCNRYGVFRAVIRNASAVIKRNMSRLALSHAMYTLDGLDSWRRAKYSAHNWCVCVSYITNALTHIVLNLDDQSEHKNKSRNSLMVDSCINWYVTCVRQ